MNRMIVLIWVAGGIQLVIAAANLALPRVLYDRENLAGASLMVRQIFTVHVSYIMLVLVGFSLLSLGFAPELAGASALGRFLSAFLAIFWLLRIPVHLHYDPAVRRQHRFADLVFLAAVIYLAATYLLAALGVGR
jgi:hypothetical protein